MPTSSMSRSQPSHLRSDAIRPLAVERGFAPTGSSLMLSRTTPANCETAVLASANRRFMC